MDYKIIEYKNEYKYDIRELISSIYRDEFEITVGEDEILNEDLYKYIKEGGIFLLAVDEDNNLLGTIGGRIVNDETLEVKRMYVKKEYRGYGIAQELLNNLESFAAENGFRYLVLGTYERMERAIGFYQKNLFVLEDMETEDVEERFFKKCLA